MCGLPCRIRRKKLFLFIIIHFTFRRSVWYDAVMSRAKGYFKLRFREMYKDRRARGVCMRCGGKRDDEGLNCSICRASARRQAREAKECRPWESGGRGRPPIGAVR